MDATDMNENLPSLDSLAQKYETDRASVFTRTYGKPHGYAAHYDRLFTPLRDQPIRLLEIGAAGGEGIKMWLEYFPVAEVLGVDIVSRTNPWNTPGESSDPRYVFCQGDQGDTAFWDKFTHFYGGDGFDVIIDDGSHINTDIIVTFIALWPHVKPGGFYAIEDLATGYGGDSYFVKPNLPNHMDWLKGKIDALNTSQGDIDSIYWSRELAVLRKAKA
jgi:hypothetical protein